MNKEYCQIKFSAMRSRKPPRFDTVPKMCLKRALKRSQRTVKINKNVHLRGN